MWKFATMALLAIFPLGLFAARLTLRDGTVVYGQFVSGTTQQIIFQDEGGVRRRFDLDRIQNIDFNSGSGPAALNQREPYNNTANRFDDRAPERVWATLPRGTELSVRNDESINSQTAVEGRTYPATIQRDVVDDRGVAVIPRGSEAQLIIRMVNEGGTLSNGNFILDLDSVRVNGHRYRVSTVDMEAKDSNGIGKNKRTAEMVGGGAVLGTLLGAIAGGGKGAAIGAAAGAATGGGVQVLTKGHEIRVPAESVLNFRLDEPLHLREMQ